MNNTTVYIIHGFMASPSDHWFEWLKQSLEQYKINVKILDLPNPSSPDPISWQQSLFDNITKIDSNSYFVAHSLGCISLLTFLQEKNVSVRLGGMILVSGFLSPLPTLPILDRFTEYKICSLDIIELIPKRLVIGSRHDTIVPYEFTESLANNLDAEFEKIDNAGHFLADDGYDTFPQLLENLLKMIFK